MNSILIQSQRNEILSQTTLPPPHTRPSTTYSNNSPAGVKALNHSPGDLHIIRQLCLILTNEHEIIVTLLFLHNEKQTRK